MLHRSQFAEAATTTVGSSGNSCCVSKGSGEVAVEVTEVASGGLIAAFTDNDATGLETGTSPVVTSGGLIAALADNDAM